MLKYMFLTLLMLLKDRIRYIFTEMNNNYKSHFYIKETIENNMKTLNKNVYLILAGLFFILDTINWINTGFAGPTEFNALSSDPIANFLLQEVGFTWIVLMVWMVYEVYTKTNTMEWWYTIPVALIAFIVGNSPAIPLYLYLRTTDLKPGSLNEDSTSTESVSEGE